MPSLDVPLFDNPDTTAALSRRFAAMEPQAFLRLVIETLFPGRIALVSSFGAESAVLLHLAAKIDPALPVLFIDTDLLFPETLAYRDTLVELLGLKDVRVIKPEPAQRAAEDPENFLWASNADRCCEIRKVLPLANALEPFDAWITGRKRFQAATRAALSFFEQEEGTSRIKVNPLAGWTAQDLAAYLKKWDLPAHPLVAKGYPSIGCIPCTSPVRPGEDARAGRWRDKGKVECGIHIKKLEPSPDA
ncbi:phosphoadenylyl-sulfate reductase [Beijerinckia indica]|uniref:Adenosine 5'-phosphosulfate reductase n=1 Tax=Beijerinckia indica subsp. indica (strain ATCC 9039 / DSM 1715 / NCIMB 8712) TaxID=395963 RepID=B2IH94_BEII9|nr:phosphoadenylyl-sulfate reductase [Beijerinckia indica]ACB95879.1 phosphoadenosine phosphosulfate reductase [Beijerinckia indica subsp. indica ATCC 9039]